MPEVDLVIRGGTVVDGSGRAGYRADLAIKDDRVAAIGKIEGRGKREIDADGLVVTPGFIDGHTHMDAQVFWDELGTASNAARNRLCTRRSTDLRQRQRSSRLDSRRPEEL